MEMSKHYIIPIFVPHLGCPHDCVFCNQKRITNVSTNITGQDVETTIKEYLSYFKEDSFIEVAFYGGSFTAINMDIQKELLEIPFKYKEKGIIDAIRVSTRPDAIHRQILDNLKSYTVDTIELGVQSMDQDVLNKSGRGHSTEDVYEAVSLIKEYDINLGLQMMVGLPGDNITKDIDTARKFIELDPDCVRIYPTLVIKDTYLESLYISNKYNPLDIQEAVHISSILLILFYLNDINVIRVGLQATENIQLGRDVKAGPFHPAFRQLVESNIYKEILDYYFKENNINTKDEILKIEVSCKEISNISGQKSVNIKYLREIYGFKKISIYARDTKNINIAIGDFTDELDLNSLRRDYIRDYFKANNMEFHLKGFNIMK